MNSYILKYVTSLMSKFCPNAPAFGRSLLRLHNYLFRNIL
jgi:hypothetical protein